MANKKQVTWGGRFNVGPAALMVAYGESVSYDQRLAPFDIAGSKAHSQMLGEVGILTKKEVREIHAGLDAILREVEAGTFSWDVALEDVHMNIEQALTKRVPAAAKLHTARSRNDQVATDMRLFFKDASEKIITHMQSLMVALVQVAEKYQAVYIPGYTHLQRAQPVSVAHHLLAYVEMLCRDVERMDAVWHAANICPLGSGAIAGTTLPINRERVAELLGFVDEKGQPILTQNSMDAISDRDVFIDFLHACSVCAVHLSRFAEDMILWNSSEFGFVHMSDEFTTGSSLMPQKKNPDAMEILRGKAPRMAGHWQTLVGLLKGLPLTYNRDLQDDKPPVFDAFDQMCLSLQVCAEAVAGMEMNPARCAQAVSDPLLLATDLADYLVEQKVAFRDAHHAVGSVVALAEKKACLLTELTDEEVQQIHPAFASDWKKVFDLKRALCSREKTGMPGPKQIKKQITAWKKLLEA